MIVAGGQGTRLGFDGPKGCYPIGPVTDRSLFQIHAEKVVALGRRHGVSVPLYVMTSPQNHAETAAFFDEHESFGVEHLRLFVQGEMPAVDRLTGRILLAERGRVALSPDGHGGTIRALERSGALAEMAERGIRTIFYLQVDNPLIAIGDPGFLGVHRRLGAEMSSKVVRKTDPAEKVGLVVVRDGRQEMIEYSDLPDELADRRGSDGASRALGRLDGAASHRSCVRDQARGGGREAAVPSRAQAGAVRRRARVDDRAATRRTRSSSSSSSSTPFRSRAGRSSSRPTARRSSSRSRTPPGPASPETVRARLSALYAGWLEAAGASVPRGEDGVPDQPIEISPLVALDAADLAGRVDLAMPSRAPCSSPDAHGSDARPQVTGRVRAWHRAGPARHPAPTAVRPLRLAAGAALPGVPGGPSVPRRAVVRALRASHRAAGRRVPRMRRPPAGIPAGGGGDGVRGRRARPRPAPEERPAARARRPGGRGDRDAARRGPEPGRVLGAGRLVADDPARMPSG